MFPEIIPCSISLIDIICIYIYIYHWWHFPLLIVYILTLIVDKSTDVAISAESVSAESEGDVVDFSAEERSQVRRFLLICDPRLDIDRLWRFFAHVTLLTLVVTLG